MPKDYAPFYRRWYFNTLTRVSARKADKVISVSQDNMRQIIRYLGVPESKVAVIYHGLDESFRPVKDSNIIESCKAKYGINNDYILCVANNVLNKNLEGLIKAFDYLRQKYRIPHKLVIVGNTGFSKEREVWLQEIKGKYPDLIHTGYVDYKELPALYSGASVFVLPSYCESFGIPLLEAMACGVPVVTSNIFAMPEVVGDAGLKVNPYDFKEIGDAVYKLLTNNALREEFIKRGLERVKAFTWEKAAKEALAVYEEVYRS
ncbi:MAG: Mannosylfructose-phosphate synthase [candidate division WS2 bacterium]|nr:Mannosylfructose-phosphate synthase [Candidatus Lithacetigena glycinireducens]